MRFEILVMIFGRTIDTNSHPLESCLTLLIAWIVTGLINNEVLLGLHLGCISKAPLRYDILSWMCGHLGQFDTTDRVDARRPTIPYDLLT